MEHESGHGRLLDYSHLESPVPTRIVPPISVTALENDYLDACVDYVHHSKRRKLSPARINLSSPALFTGNRISGRDWQALAPWREQSSPGSSAHTSEGDHGSFAGIATVKPKTVHTSMPMAHTSGMLLPADHGKEHALTSSQVCFGMLIIPLETQRQDVRVSAPTKVFLMDNRVCSADNVDAVFGTLAQVEQHVLAQLRSIDELELQLLFVQQHGRQSAGELLSILYGPRNYAEDISSFLDGCQQYLQDPPQFCDRIVLYDNPQSFVQRKFYTQCPQTATKDITGHANDAIDSLSDLVSGSDLAEARTPSALRTRLLKHQSQALNFMLRRESASPRLSYDLWKPHPDQRSFLNVISGETIEWHPPDFRGGILADQMGLGKSLSAIALIASDIDHGFSGTTLVIVRAALLDTWVHELSKHTHEAAFPFRVHHGRSRVKSAADLRGVMVVLSTYHTLMAEWKKHQSSYQFAYSTLWRRVVLDEAHDIRDGKSTVFKAVCALTAEARWALTGTPIQNGLSDMASLFKFVQVYPYDDPKAFNWQLSALIGKHGIDRARDLLKLVMLRRSTDILTLPARHKSDVRLIFSDEEQMLYDKIKLRTKQAMHGETELHTFSLVHKLLAVCVLGTAAKGLEDDLGAEWSRTVAQAHFNTLVTAGWAMCQRCSSDIHSLAAEAGDVPPGLDSRPFVTRCRKLICGTCFSVRPECDDHSACEPHHVAMMGMETLEDPHADNNSFSAVSTKIRTLIQDLTKHQLKEKCVVFSQWTSTLDVIERELLRHGLPCVRIDGNVGQKTRDKSLQSFRTNETIRIVLLTISCGAVGLDLTAASRVYLMEPNWNPAVEQQALARVHRLGQIREVTTIRYIMHGSIEEHVLNVQEKKQALSALLIPANAAAESTNRVEGLQEYL